MMAERIAQRMAARVRKYEVSLDPMREEMND